MTVSLATVKPEILVKLLDEAVEFGREESKVPEPHWYPCGFAWLSIKMRKNGRLAKTLIAYGFRWNDYDKAYQTSMYDRIVSIENMSQSMDYRARVLNAVTACLHIHGLTEFYVNTRID